MSLKKIFFVLLFFPFLSSARIYINVGPPQKTVKSNFVISNFRLDAKGKEQTKDDLLVGQKMKERFSSNMIFSSYFLIVSPKAYMEDLDKVSPVPYPKEILGFRYESWKIIGADFLFFGSYFIDEEDLFLTVYLYNINSKKRILKKTYKAKTFQSDQLVDILSNDIIKKLTGYKSIFGTQIAAVRSTGKFKKELFVMDWNGKNKKRISYHNSIVMSPAWSPERDQIAYSAFVINKKLKKRVIALFLYNFQKNKVRLLSHQSNSVLSSGFFPRGKNMLVSRGLGKGYTNIFKFNIKNSIFVPLIQGGKRSINVESRIHYKTGRLVFSSDRGGRTAIYTADSNGKNIKKVTHLGNHNSNPDWHPHKREFVFSAWSQGRMDLFLSSKEGASIRRLTSLKKKNGAWANSQSPSFSPDGRFVVFSSNVSGHYQLYILNIKTFSIERITFDRNNYSSPQWSPY